MEREKREGLLIVRERGLRGRKGKEKKRGAG